MTYLELENKEICLFGAGYIGKTQGYETIKAFGLNVDFYCDNNIMPGTIVRDGIEVRDIQYLYRNKERIWVFITVSKRYQEQIAGQLEEHGIHNFEVIDWAFISHALDAIDASDDEMLKHRSHAIYDDLEYLEKFCEHMMGYKLNISNPTTYNEKLQWLKLYNRRPEYTGMVDKYEAKQFIEKRIGSGYTVPTLGVWDSFEEIEFDKLPRQFVLKCTHDSGSIVFVEDKENFDKEETKNILTERLGRNFFWIGREWPYKNVKPRIIAETMLPEKNLNDYKFFCFDGRVKMIQVDFDRFINHRRNFYNREWKYEPFMSFYPSEPERVIDRPRCLDEMIEIAEKLSCAIPHLRVDFYIINDRPIVGELTFFHENGLGKFTPAEWDEIFGGWISLPEKTES